MWALKEFRAYDKIVLHYKDKLNVESNGKHGRRQFMGGQKRLCLRGQWAEDKKQQKNGDYCDNSSSGSGGASDGRR